MADAALADRLFYDYWIASLPGEPDGAVARHLEDARWARGRAAAAGEPHANLDRLIAAAEAEALRRGLPGR